MIKILNLYFFLSFSLSGTFNFISQSATIDIENSSMIQPFLGGFNSPKVQWVNWDLNLDNELFSLDEE